MNPSLCGAAAGPASGPKVAAEAVEQLGGEEQAQRLALPRRTREGHSAKARRALGPFPLCLWVQQPVRGGVAGQTHSPPSCTQGCPQRNPKVHVWEPQGGGWRFLTSPRDPGLTFRKEEEGKMPKLVGTLAPSCCWTVSLMVSSWEGGRAQ